MIRKTIIALTFVVVIGSMGTGFALIVSTDLASDDFEDGNVNGWERSGNATAEIRNVGIEGSWSLYANSTPHANESNIAFVDSDPLNIQDGFNVTGASKVQGSGDNPRAVRFGFGQDAGKPGDNVFLIFNFQDGKTYLGNWTQDTANEHNYSTSFSGQWVKWEIVSAQGSNTVEAKVWVIENITDQHGQDEDGASVLYGDNGDTKVQGEVKVIPKETLTVERLELGLSSTQGNCPTDIDVYISDGDIDQNPTAGTLIKENWTPSCSGNWIEINLDNSFDAVAGQTYHVGFDTQFAENDGSRDASQIWQDNSVSSTYWWTNIGGTANAQAHIRFIGPGSKPANYELQRTYQGIGGKFYVNVGDEQERDMWLDSVDIDGEELVIPQADNESDYEFNARRYMDYGTSQEYSIIDLTTDNDVTAFFTVTSNNTDIITVDAANQSFVATDNESRAGMVLVSASFENVTLTKNITVANRTISNIGIMPPSQYPAAFLGFDESGSEWGIGSEVTWLYLIIIIAGTIGGVAKNEWLAIGLAVFFSIIFWVLGNVSLGIVLANVFLGILLGIVLLNVPTRRTPA